MNTTDKSSQYQYMSTKSVSMSTNYSIKPDQTKIPPKLLVGLLAKTICCDGYVDGYKQPIAIINLQVARCGLQTLKNLQDALTFYLKSSPASLMNPTLSADVATCFAEGLCTLQKAAGFPIFALARVERSIIRPDEFKLYVPMLDESCMHYLIDFLLEFFNNSPLLIPGKPNKSVMSHIEGLIARLSVYAPKGSNTLRFLQAAHSSDIPWMHVEQNVFQLGYGVKSRWFDSSFTDQTPAISSVLARSKLSTAMLLRKAGLPVPEQHLAHNEAEAISFAQKIGYPVVIKPLSADGGDGVSAGLMSDEAVKNAWQCAQNYSNPVLLEKHVVGKDYRLQVLNGELIWAIERIPARITGDGIQTIRILIDDFNSQQGHQKSLTLKAVAITEELVLFLADQGYTLDSIPKPGQFVLISRIANVSAGGTPVGVFDKVHPDNKRLAETAANLLRLDIAGIDLILPDIQESYLETGGTIIEVNAQPHLGIITAPHIYKDILLKLMPEKGRIPIVVVVGSSAQNSLFENISQVLFTECKVIGVADATGSRINGKQISITESLFTAGKSLILNKTVDALIYHVMFLDEPGLPFDAFDYLFILDDVVKTNSDDNHLMETLLKACRGPVFTTEASLDHMVTANIKNASLYSE